LIDKKYRDGLPNCVSLIDIQDHSANEAEQSKTKKRKSMKKTKPGKNGLYPMEESLIRKWWSSHDDDTDIGVPGRSKEELTKSRLSQLRIRETQLQMIVILEVLALQPLASATLDAAEDLPAVLPTVEGTEAKGKLAKNKKPDHLSMLIDVHIDRLCIWQTIESETAKETVGESQTPANSGGSTGQVKHTDNLLKDFCVEVVAPL
jgi:DNA replication regulator SLD3